MSEPVKCSAGVVGCLIFFDDHAHAPTPEPEDALASLATETLKCEAAIDTTNQRRLAEGVLALSAQNAELVQRVERYRSQADTQFEMREAAEAERDALLQKIADCESDLNDMSGDC